MTLLLTRTSPLPDELLSVLAQLHRLAPAPAPSVACDLVPDREVIPHDLESYDAHGRRD